MVPPAVGRRQESYYLYIGKKEMTMRVKMILPALQEAESPYWRPIKYVLFPPIGLATLAAYFGQDDDVVIQDQHVEPLTLDDEAALVCIQVYVTNAYRAYAIADSYRSRGVYVAMGGLHVTALLDEAVTVLPRMLGRAAF